MLLGGPLDGRMQVVEKDALFFCYYELLPISFEEQCEKNKLLPNYKRFFYRRTTSRTMLHEDEHQ